MEFKNLITVQTIDQAIGRDGGKGVNPSAILNAVRDPIQVITKVDNLGRTGIKYVGEVASVVLNKAGEIVSTWATSGQGVRGL